MNEHISIFDAPTSRRMFLGGSAVLALSLFIDPQTAHAATAAEKQAEADAALASLNAMEEKLDEAEVNYHTAVSEQEAAQAKMDEAQARIDEVSNQIADCKAGSAAVPAACTVRVPRRSSTFCWGLRASKSSPRTGTFSCR